MTTDLEKQPIFNLRSILAYIFVIVTTVVLGVVVFDTLSRRRAASVYNSYYKETEAYVQKNSSGLRRVFVEMSGTKCQFEPCQNLNNEEIMGLVSKKLTDFSSIGFVAVNARGQMMFMNLAGEKYILRNADWGIKSMRELINGERSELPWQDYTYHIEGKEIVVPVKGSVGNIVGLLIRGNIEDN